MALSLRSELLRARWWHAILAFVQSNGIEVAIFLGIVSSVLASLGARLDWLTDPWKTIIPAVAGVVLLVERQFRYKLRSAWHQEYKMELRALERLVRDEGADEPTVSRLLTELDRKMRKAYPAVSEPGPPAPSAA